MEELGEVGHGVFHGAADVVIPKKWNLVRIAMSKVFVLDGKGRKGHISEDDPHIDCALKLLNDKVVTTKENGVVDEEMEPNQTLKFGEHKGPTEKEFVGLGPKLPNYAKIDPDTRNLSMKNWRELKYCFATDFLGTRNLSGMECNVDNFGGISGAVVDGGVVTDVWDLWKNESLRHRVTCVA